MDAPSPSGAPTNSTSQLTELWPGTDPVADPVVANAAIKRPGRADRPWVAMVMIASLDGAAEIDGRSGGLGAPSDKAVFGSMRAMADAIIVGAETVRAENYGLVPPRNVDGRITQGQTPSARLAVLSHSLHFGDAPRLLSQPGPEGAAQKPLIYTTATPTASQNSYLQAAEVVTLEDTAPATVLKDLADRGVSVAVLEGGPTVNAQFLAADMVDEINLSLAPWAAAGTASRIAQGEHAAVPVGFRLERVWLGDEIVFTRHVRDRS